MFFRRAPKTPLMYAMNFIEISGEIARLYMHDPACIPTPQIMAELHELKRTMSIQHSSMSYIISMLEARMHGLDPNRTDDTPDE